MKLKKGIKKTEWLIFLFPSLIGTTIFVFIPFLDMFRRSFYNVMADDFVEFTNYAIILKNQAFLLAITNTIKFILCCIPLLIVVSFGIALFISNMKCMDYFKSILLLPMAMPTATLVLIWQMLFDDYGVINGILAGIGADRISFLGSDAALGILVGSYIWKNLGYTVVLWLSGIMGISEDIINAAKVDGASTIVCIYKIILPNLKNCFFTVLLISFLNSCKVFREAYLVSGSYPHESIYMIQHLFNNWFVNFEINKIAAATVILFIVLFVVILFIQLRKLKGDDDE